MYTKDGFHKALEQKLGDDAYLLLAAGGHKKLADLLTSASLGASGNNTTLSITVGGTTKSNSITVPYASKAGTWETERTLTIGSTGKSVNGSKNVTWSLDEIGVYSKTAADDRYVNVTGDTMTGNLTFSEDNYVRWSRNTDYASISFKNTGDGDSDSYMNFETADNGNEYFRFSHTSGSNVEWMTIKSDGVRVKGNLVLHAGNYTDYTVTKTGSGASGTWGINITGNAGTATTWQTARTLTIGSTGKSVNGSANVTWTLDEIGVYSKTAADDKYVNVTGDTMSGQLYINLDQDVGLNQNGSLVIGNKAGENLAFDGNEIMARNNSSAATLYLQAEGGNLYSSAGTNYFSGSVGIGTASPSQKLHVSGGIIQINANSRYLQLGPQNSSWAHLQSDVNFYFNQSIYVDGHMMPYSNANRDLGGSSNKWRYFYINNRMYTDEWIEYSGSSGLYWPNSNEAAHIYPNTTTSYGAFLIRGARNGYAGIQLGRNGTNTGYMTIMDNQDDKGLYEEDWNWILYFNRRNKKLSFRTSSDLGADNNFNGSITAWNFRIHGSAQSFNCNDVAYTGLWYYSSNGPSTSIGASTTDGALYSQAYSTSWVGQIAQDYRNGGLYVRGKNNGTWQSWYTVLDTRNYTGLLDGRYVFKTGDSMSGTLSVCSATESAYPNAAAIEIRERNRGTTGITHNYANAPRIGFHWGDRYWCNITYYDSWFRFMNHSCSGYIGVISSGFYHSGYGSSAYLLRSDGGVAAFNWSGQSGQPTWVWGGNSQHTYYVYNPSNFSVNYANSAGSATYATNATRLYASDSPYRYGDSAPYYAYFTYNDYGDNRWYMRVSPATPSTIRVDYAGSAGNADTVDSYHASGLFETLSFSGSTLTVKIGGTQKTCTISTGSTVSKSTSCSSNRYVVGTDLTSGNFTVAYCCSQFYFTSSGAYHTSDIRKKYDIRDIYTDEVTRLFNTDNAFIRHFKWKESNKDAYGFIAQELAEYCPEAVDLNNDTGYYAVNYNVAFSKIIGAMYKEIKHLREEVKILKGEA